MTERAVTHPACAVTSLLSPHSARRPLQRLLARRRHVASTCLLLASRQAPALAPGAPETSTVRDRIGDVWSSIHPRLNSHVPCRRFLCGTSRQTLQNAPRTSLKKAHRFTERSSCGRIFAARTARQRHVHPGRAKAGEISRLCV